MNLTFTESREMLNVDYTTSAKELKTAWRKFVQKNHPDKYDGAEDKVLLIQKANLAYDLLLTHGCDARDPETYQEETSTGGTPDSSVHHEKQDATILDEVANDEVLSIWIISKSGARYRLLFRHFSFFIMLFLIAFGSHVPFYGRTIAGILALVFFFYIPGYFDLSFRSVPLTADDDGIWVGGPAGGRIQWEDLDDAYLARRHGVDYLLIRPIKGVKVERTWLSRYSGFISGIIEMNPQMIIISETDLGINAREVLTMIQTLYSRRMAKRFSI